MKKLLTLFFALTCASVLLASDTQVNGIWYYLDSSKKIASVTYRGSNHFEYDNEYTGTIVIPETITFNNTTYSVTTIGGYAFMNCSGLISVTIPNSVTTIGRYAFGECFGLASVTIPNSVTTIGSYAFYKCSRLTSTKIPNSVTTIGSYAFSGCSGLTAVEIPYSVTSIGDWAFSDCNSLTSITIVNPNVKIGKGAFYNCTITDLYCGESVDLSETYGTLNNVHRISEEELTSFLPFDQYAKCFVEPQINKWQKKGEFEKTSDWQARVNETTRKQQIDTLVRDAKKIYLAGYQKRNSPTFTLGTYDADNEVYLVKSNGGKDLLVAVPIDEASYVKQNWESHTASPQYDIQGTEIVVTSVGFTFPNQKTYTYKIDEKLTYATADINYNFDPIELPELQTVTMGGTAQAPQAQPQAAQGITEVVVTTPFDLTSMSSVLVSYKNIFGKYEMPDLDVTFPYVVIRVKLTGTPNLIRLAKQSLSLDLGQSYIVEQTVPQDDKILFLVPSGAKNIYLTDGNGQRQLLYSGRLQPNTIYDGTVEVK